MDEMTLARELPQLDASSLVDPERLESEVKAIYRQVARLDGADLNFEVGRDLAEQLGYPSGLLDAIPAEALASFAGVGYHLDLAALRPGHAVLDLGSGSGTDLLCAAVLVGDAGRVVGVDFTDAQLDKATRLGTGFSQVELIEAHIEALPFEDASFDVVVSNGVINLSPRKHRVFAEAARVLRPGGRLAISDIVSGRALKERTRRNVDLWAACIAGAIPRDSYLEAIVAQGLKVCGVCTNDYRFVSGGRSRPAASTRSRASRSWPSRPTKRRPSGLRGAQAASERDVGQRPLSADHGDTDRHPRAGDRAAGPAARRQVARPRVRHRGGRRAGRRAWSGGGRHRPVAGADRDRVPARGRAGPGDRLPGRRCRAPRPRGCEL